METAKQCTCSSRRLCGGALAISLGVTFALLMVVLGLVAWHLHTGGQWVAVVSSVYVGFALTAKGIVIGALWGFAEGFILGLVIAGLYNFVAKCCKCKCCKGNCPTHPGINAL